MMINELITFQNNDLIWGLTAILRSQLKTKEENTLPHQDLNRVPL